MSSRSLEETVELINACYEQHRENEARWEKEDRMDEAELHYYRAVQCMNSAIGSLRSSAKWWSDIDQLLMAKFCEEKAVSLENGKPPMRVEFVLAAELLKEQTP
ncbi:hypothetical protein LCGC14_0259180 [marine sediment metagenome]|uniref:Uncharacterized protein n=1 Tax=marine sediment metagenome TaxID=412755 RepID=A0A0F9X7B0_9ZZZZ